MHGTIVIGYGISKLIKFGAGSWEPGTLTHFNYIAKSCTYTRLRDVGRDYCQAIHIVHMAPLELAVQMARARRNRVDEMNVVSSNIAKSCISTPDY